MRVLKGRAMKIKSEKTSGRKLYSIGESYIISYRGFITIRKLSHAKKNDLIDQQFIERIMLAVTEVNGCPVCSYAHTKMALESGMTIEEIESMLAGTQGNLPPDEIPAIMFAQHYAEYRGCPSQESWDRVVEIYGEPKALGILGAIRIIMIGNAYGVPWSSFFNRFKGKPDSRSNLLYEIGMIITSIVFIPLALIHSLLARLFRLPIINF